MTAMWNYKVMGQRVKGRQRWCWKDNSEAVAGIKLWTFTFWNHLIRPISFSEPNISTSTIVLRTVTNCILTSRFISDHNGVLPANRYENAQNLISAFSQGFICVMLSHNNRYVSILKLTLVIPQSKVLLSCKGNTM